MSELSRRSLLRNGALALGALMGLPACSKQRVFSCNAVDGLSVDEILPRNKLGYTDASADPARTCLACQQYLAGPSDDQCGGCKVMKGPVHPGGTCKSYLPKA